REKHSALLDCRLLAAVYVELVGGHQARLDFVVNGGQGALLQAGTESARPRLVPLLPRLTAEEAEAHRAFVAGLGADTVWTALLSALSPGSSIG
ncbi:MAG: DNA polymerase III subunit epsilon, partial [Methyloceanibacter sp.]